MRQKTIDVKKIDKKHLEILGYIKTAGGDRLHICVYTHKDDKVTLVCEKNFEQINYANKTFTTVKEYHTWKSRFPQDYMQCLSEMLAALIPAAGKANPKKLPNPKTVDVKNLLKRNLEIFGYIRDKRGDKFHICVYTHLLGQVTLVCEKRFKQIPYANKTFSTTREYNDWKAQFSKDYMTCLSQMLDVLIPHIHPKTPTQVEIEKYLQTFLK